jgi:hypothetical protein
VPIVATSCSTMETPASSGWPLGGDLAPSRPIVQPHGALCRAHGRVDRSVWRRRHAVGLQRTELRKQAARYLRRRGAPELLQPTALVHEVFVRLTGADNVD